MISGGSAVRLLCLDLWLAPIHYELGAGREPEPGRHPCLRWQLQKLKALVWDQQTWSNPPRGVVPRGTGGGCFGFLEVSCMIFQRGSSHPFSSYSRGLLGAGKLWGWGDIRWPRWRSDPGGTASGLISWKCTDLVWVSEALTDHRREEPHNDLAVN